MCKVLRTVPGPNYLLKLPGTNIYLHCKCCYGNDAASCLNSLCQGSSEMPSSVILTFCKQMRFLPLSDSIIICTLLTAHSVFCCVLEIPVNLLFSSYSLLTWVPCYQTEPSDGSTAPAGPCMVLAAEEEGSWQLLVTLNSVEPRIPVPTKSRVVGLERLLTDQSVLGCWHRERYLSKVTHASARNRHGNQLSSYQQHWAPPKALGYVSLHGMEEKTAHVPEVKRKGWDKWQHTAKLQYQSCSQNRDALGMHTQKPHQGEEHE